MQTCAVIGCGAAGMAASTALRRCGLLVTCFELAPGPGGIWLSSSRDLFSARGLISPLYPTMRCALPKDLMSFSDVRFDLSVPQFPHHTAVRHYLDRYAERKGVHGLTRFNTKVESARFDGREGVWRLITVNVTSGDVMEWSFDKVCVCTGQTHEACYPAGLREERLAAYVQAGGEVHHAFHIKDFRAMKGKRVVVLGDGATAYDYCVGLKHHGAAAVFHSTLLNQNQGGARAAHPANEMLLRWMRYRNDCLEGIARVGAPLHADGRGIVFAADPMKPLGLAAAVQEARWRRLAAVRRGATAAVAAKTEEEDHGTMIDGIDSLISATGYRLRFPFLHPSLRAVLEEDWLYLPPPTAGAAAAPPANTRGLYMGTVYAACPSLAFVGLPRELLPPFLLFEAQARFIAYVFARRVALPSTAPAMTAEERQCVARNHPALADLYSPRGLGLHSGAYFDALQQQLGVGSRETYVSTLLGRRRWLLASVLLRVYHKFRSLAPLKRRRQHLLFSNDV